MRNQHTWVVTVKDNDDSVTYGPYTMLSAETIAQDLQRWFVSWDDAMRPRANAYPLQAATITDIKKEWAE